MNLESAGGTGASLGRKSSMAAAGMAAVMLLFHPDSETGHADWESMF